MSMSKAQKIYLPFKRTIDIIGSTVGIIFCSILVFWWVIIINTIVSKGHPFFNQERYGKNKKIYRMYKFRSMKLDAAEIAPMDMTPEVQASMTTKFGRFLRATSIDEMPQLINILKGDMSFIGPRPGAAHGEEYLADLRLQYTPNAFDVKPGLTGFAQTRMNRTHEAYKKAWFDHQYVLKMSFLFDCKLFILTCIQAFGALRGR